ncbi:hypothetical protein B0O80DRAFT_141090 [Mortierella sp. GBAus27b]|nr:hypothetical protein B0O80DRAFT_141090 [Mortierella sp. GBAus27b]
MKLYEKEDIPEASTPATSERTTVTETPAAIRGPAVIKKSAAAEEPDVVETPARTVEPVVVENAAETEETLVQQTGAPPVYNILLLGPTQAGKSTFIEGAKQYADPSYVIDKHRIGNGNESCTAKVHVDEITTRFPIYKLYDLKDDSQEYDFSRIKNEKDFRKFLDREDDLLLRPEEEDDAAQIRFRFFDTPGLDDTDGNDVQNIAKILTTLSEVDELHLVLILDSHHVPLVQSQKAAFAAYFELFQRLKDLMIIVHTHVPNQNRFPGTNPKLDNKLKERSEVFNTIAGREVPSKRIDCDLDETGPVHTCLTRNAIRELLEIATIKAPAVMRTTHIHKLPAMTAVDGVVHRRYQAKMDALAKARDACSRKNEAALLTFKVQESDIQIQRRIQLLERYDTDERIPLFEKRFGEEISFLGIFKGLLQDLLGRDNEVHTMNYRHPENVIERLDVRKNGVDVVSESGGKGQTHWETRFKKQPFRPGYYFHAVLSTTNRFKYKDEIKKLKSELKVLEKTKQDQLLEKMKLDVLVQQQASAENVERLKSKKEKYEKVLDLTGATTLPVGVFLELANAGIYNGTNAESSANKLDARLTAMWELD